MLSGLMHVCLGAQSCLTLCDPTTVIHQAPLFMGFSRQEYWGGLPFPPPGDLLNTEMEPSVRHIIQHRNYSQYFIIILKGV